MKYQIITYGCQMNESDSQRLGQYLDSRGWSQARDASEADLIFFNACSVRQSAVDRLYAKVKKLQSKNKKAQIILIGCILPKDKIKFTNLDVKIRHIEQLPLCHSDANAQVPIMRGCNNWCSYCAVPLTKGRERCRPAQDIITEVKKLVTAGYYEIALLGQNVNSYRHKIKNPACASSLSLRASAFGRRSRLRPTKSAGRQKSNFKNKNQISKTTDFPCLIQMINSLPGDFKIRFLTNHPRDMSDKLIKTIAQCDKVIKEIHLPFQSGDDAILKAMNRHYTKQQYLDLVKKIKLIIPDVKITTDIIVGFPNETEKQFQQTIDIVKKVGFAKAYISKYSPRPGTVASHLTDNIPMAEKKQREQILRKYVN